MFSLKLQWIKNFLKANRILSQQRVVITGGAGFILSHSQTNSFVLAIMYVPTLAVLRPQIRAAAPPDYLDPDAVRGALQSIDAVYLSAAIGGPSMFEFLCN